jgi:hypothetical protein
MAQSLIELIRMLHHLRSKLNAERLRRYLSLP